MLNSQLIIKLSPLLVATVHGYGAAWLAVKMLFRPRKPIFFMGLRLPLTPGMLPKERETFIEALSAVIAHHLLDVETIAGELAKLNLESEITTIARRGYMEQSRDDSTVQVVVEHLRSQLQNLRDSVETRLEIVGELRKIIELEVGRRFNLFRKLVFDFFLDEAALNRIVGDSIDQLASQIVDSLYVRTTISQAMAQIPETVFRPDGRASATAVKHLVTILSERLDLNAILKRRLSALSNEEIEHLIMETAGKEIRAIVWFGAGIGMVVGVVQTVINFL